jgi:uncharacterized membrane protein
MKWLLWVTVLVDSVVVEANEKQPYQKGTLALGTRVCVCLLSVVCVVVVVVVVVIVVVVVGVQQCSNNDKNRQFHQLRLTSAYSSPKNK